MPPNDPLEAALLRAHAANDAAALANLYRKAAEQAPTEAQQAFFLTQAYIFALEVGAPTADPIRQRLVALKREC